MNAQQFLNAEEAADQLVATLEQLKSEIQSYSGAKEELSKVRERLEHFIDRCGAIGKDTQAIVQEIKSIGGPELFSRIEKVETTLLERTGKLQVLVVLVGVLALAAAVLAALPLIR